ncbi:MAG: hypothetical protein JWO79_3096 [Actinomycetia bacterium]|nr:hypothetical protein [Actinomycetes bacterium]MDQ1653294.1 hypothetical protein [Cryptosporangiaceae bacterium]
MTASRPGPSRRPRVVAFGGGHGLFASLRALRRLDAELTAVVTVADDGGSSGRLRGEFGVLPPGDLRQALVALAGEGLDTELAAVLFQHRFPGSGPLGGHAVGNLILTGLADVLGGPVPALDHAGRMLGACGRVLPMSAHPLAIEADVRGDDPARPTEVRVVRGQASVAKTHGEVLRVRIVPEHPPACPEALAAVAEADWLVFGPGSWFTSVLPHFLVPQLREAIGASPARKIVTLNLAAEPGETHGWSAEEHLAVFGSYAMELKVDTVLADPRVVRDHTGLAGAAESLGARLLVAPVAVADGSPRHDPGALAAALRSVLERADQPGWDETGR